MVGPAAGEVVDAGFGVQSHVRDELVVVEQDSVVEVDEVVDLGACPSGPERYPGARQFEVSAAGQGDRVQELWRLELVGVRFGFRAGGIARSGWDPADALVG